MQQEEKIQMQKRELEKTKRKLQDRHFQLEKQRSYDNLYEDTPILEPVTIVTSILYTNSLYLVYNATYECTRNFSRKRRTVA